MSASIHVSTRFSSTFSVCDSVAFSGTLEDKMALISVRVCGFATLSMSRSSCGALQVHTPCRAQPWFSWWQALGQPQELFLDYHGVERSSGHERLSYRRRASRRAMPKLLAWCNEAVVVHWTPPLARGTSAHGRRRETFQGESSFACSCVESHFRPTTKSH
jgi:hypothetical protein